MSGLNANVSNKKTKINEKEARVGPFFYKKELRLSLTLISLFQMSLVTLIMCPDAKVHSSFDVSMNLAGLRI